jgi:hypothetical protein
MAETYTSPVGGAQERSSGIVDRVKESAAAQLTTQKNRGTDALGQVANAVRSSTQKLREERHDTIAGYIDKAAEHIDSWSQRLRERDIDELMSDVQRLARRQPAVFIGSAFALGLVGSRFFKSSRKQSESLDTNDSRRARYGGAAGPSTVHDYSARDREDEAIVSEVVIADIATGEPTPSTSGAEGAGRSNRGRRTTPRAGQP